MPADHDQRLERERTFHDERFAGHKSRTKTTRFYEVDSGKRAYKKAVLALAPGTDVLEYGCGRGSLAIPLTARRATVTGIDIVGCSNTSPGPGASPGSWSSASVEEPRTDPGQQPNCARSHADRASKRCCGATFLTSGGSSPRG